MGTTEQKRQKKLAKKRSKEIAKRKQRAAEKNALKSLSGQVLAALRSNDLRCYCHGSYDDGGICTMIAARPLPDGQLFCAFFLVDLDCLGIKDSFGRSMFPSQLHEWMDQFGDTEKLTKCAPELAKKLVVEAAAWSAQFGFSPRGDYQRLSAIWKDIDQSQCGVTFQFGRDGKPAYFQGPNDSREFVARVMNTLDQNVGEGNYFYTLAMQDFEDLETLRIDSDDDDWEDSPHVIRAIEAATSDQHQSCLIGRQSTHFSSV